MTLHSTANRPLWVPSSYWRFLRKVEPEAVTGCWLWTAMCNPSGYGMFYVRPGKIVLAHRMSWALHRGDIPEGLMVLHKCDVRRCVNPDHLYCGTAQENVYDCLKRGRRPRRKTIDERKHCDRGHVAWRTNPDGTLFCWRCRREMKLAKKSD